MVFTLNRNRLVNITQIYEDMLIAVMCYKKSSCALRTSLPIDGQACQINNV